MNACHATRIVTPACVSAGSPVPSLSGIAVSTADSAARADGIGTVEVFRCSNRESARACVPLETDISISQILKTTNPKKDHLMRKILFLSWLSVALLSTASIPQSQASTFCAPVTKTTDAGTFTGNFCFDPATGTIDLSGTATLNDGRQLDVNATGSIGVSFSNWTPTVTIQYHLEITDAVTGANLLTTDLQITGNSFTLVLTT